MAGGGGGREGGLLCVFVHGIIINGFFFVWFGLVLVCVHACVCVCVSVCVCVCVCVCVISFLFPKFIEPCGVFILQVCSVRHGL